MTKDRILDIIVTISYILGPLLMAALSWASVKVSNLIGAKVQNEQIRGMLFRLNDAVLIAVRGVQQSMVDAIKKSSGGVFDDKAKEAAKAAAVTAVKNHFGQAGIDEMMKILGLTTEQMEGVIGARIESAVHDLKTGNLPPQSDK